jgi:hypothetical protein
MISVRRQHARSAFGPQSSPLYYTALSRVPRRLIVAGLDDERIYKIVLTTVDANSTTDDTDAQQQWILPARPVNGRCIWPLTELATLTEATCAWRIEETQGTAFNSSVEDCTTEEDTAQSISPREGCFRLLDAAYRDRLKQGQQHLERVRDAPLGSPASALFMAELGLYHEALSMTTTYLKHETKRGNQLVARTVQALIYKQMLKQIDQERRGDLLWDRRLGWYLTWTQNRERYHREMTVAMMRTQCPGRCLHEVALP